MEELIRLIIERLQNTTQFDFEKGVGFYLISFIVMFVGAFIIILIFAMVAGLITYLERRIAGKIQSRIGPNRVGPMGLFQFIADGVKLLTKEDILPEGADKFLFLIAPYIAIVSCFMVFVVIPFGPRFTWEGKIEFNLIVNDLNIGVFYILAATSFMVIALLMAGWSSNSKWSLLGGMRSSAQIVSYEIPLGLSLLNVVLLTGSFSTQEITKAQSGGYGIFNWFIFHNPFTFISFFIFFISALAEINRTPFDLPEAESELVSGYNTEYSGLRFAMFFISEYTNIFVLGAICTFAFLGGWQVPFISFDLADNWKVQLLGTLFFFIKAFFFVFVIIWIRWTLPRLRVDQLMSLCWKYLTPIAFITLIGTAIWMVIFRGQSIYQLIWG